MSVYDDTPPTHSFPRTWRGKFATSPASFSVKVEITIPDMDPTLRFGPCRWMPRDSISLPQRGDDCLVIFDNDREPWVVMWWPF